MPAWEWLRLGSQLPLAMLVLMALMSFTLMPGTLLYLAHFLEGARQTRTPPQDRLVEEVHIRRRTRSIREYLRQPDLCKPFYRSREWRWAYRHLHPRYNGVTVPGSA